MLNKAGRGTAPFHLEFKQTRQTGAGASHWATEDDCTPEEPDLPRFSRTFGKIIDCFGPGSP
jgi:hypothetical protein